MIVPAGAVIRLERPLSHIHMRKACEGIIRISRLIGGFNSCNENN